MWQPQHRGYGPMHRLRTSVIIPVYNAEQTIAGALASVRQQTCPPHEILVVDDASTDSTAQVAAQFPGVVVHRRLANGGPAAARNSGLDAASGDVLAFLDADDRWPPAALCALLRPLQDDPGVAIVQGRVQDVWPDHTGAPRFGYNLGSAAYRRTVFARIGRFDEARRTGEDVQFWLRVRAGGLAVQHITDVVLFYQRQADVRPDRVEQFHRSLLAALRRAQVDNRPNGAE